MKTVLSGLALAILISLGAWGLSQYLVRPASEAGTSPNQSVRLDAPDASETSDE